MKNLISILSLFIWTNPVYSSVIISDVTGADMVGIEVTANFAGGGSETVTWLSTSSDNSIPFDEGYAGGVVGSGWSLSQQGNTFGDITPGGQLLGLWTLTNNSGSALSTLVIDALVADFAFDTIDSVEGTLGSNVGRPFVTGFAGAFGTYSDLFSSPDLYGTLTLDWGQTNFASGNSMTFMADTDSIPEPATVLLLGAGLLGMAGARVRAKKQHASMKNEV